MRLPIILLGQSGCVLQFPDAVVYIDPYLSNSVQELDASDLEREVPIAFTPSSVVDADFVFLTHAHIDHCDPHSVPGIAVASPNAKFIGPMPVIRELINWGLNENKLEIAAETWVTLSDELRVKGIPAAHPDLERDEGGRLKCVGYLFDWCGKKLYIAGDTSVHCEIINALACEGRIDVAMLPVNEQNYFRNRRGIIGNMSVREAFELADEVGIGQVIPVHWDMFKVNATFSEEIRIVHRLGGYKSRLLMKPDSVNFSDVRISVVIRTLNEERYLQELLEGIKGQDTGGLTWEVVVVDSGSTDGTIEIAKQFGAVLVHIKKEDFSFGRSLNLGCAAASGDIIVITSGHCVPANENWMFKLCQQLMDGHAQYVYGRQLGGPATRHSESQIFKKYFPEQSQDSQGGAFCNNANSAILTSTWAQLRFDEEVTGLEDIELAQRLIDSGGVIKYEAEAVVYHYHDETWQQIHRRFERESIALQKIMPQLHLSVLDKWRFFLSSVMLDLKDAAQAKLLVREFLSVIRYRWNQYSGSFDGNRLHRELTKAQKERYFYPD